MANFTVYATTDSKSFIPCGIVEGSAFVTFANNIEQCKLPWAKDKIGYRVVSPCARQNHSGLAVLLQKDFILTLQP